MAKASSATLLFFILFFISAAGKLAGVNAQRTWCVTNPSADEKVLSKNTEYACSQPGVSCEPISDGGPCFYPDTVQNHASVAMNLYYQAYGSEVGDSACYFSGTGLVSSTDPSYADCKYE